MAPDTHITVARDLARLVDLVVGAAWRPACHEAISAGGAWRNAGLPGKPHPTWTEAKRAHWDLMCAFRASGISRTDGAARALVLGVAAFANPSAVFAGQNLDRARIAARYTHHHLTHPPTRR